MPYANRDVISGILLAAFAVALYLVIIPGQVEYSGVGPIALSPRLFCQITAVFLLMLSLGLIVIGLRTKASDAPASVDGDDRNHPLTRGIVAIAASVVYVLLIEPLGFFATTGVAMAFLLRFFGARGWKGTVIFLAIVMPFIYVLFVSLLKVVLPKGILF